MYDIQIHHLVMLIVLSAVVQGALAIFWFGLLFRKSWKTLTGCEADKKPANIVFRAISFFVACLILSFVLIQVVTLGGAKSYSLGSSYGIICWLGFIAPPLFAQHVFERRRANLFAINACYWLLAMAISGGILAAFH
jgi:hypothetical protein